MAFDQARDRDTQVLPLPSDAAAPRIARDFVAASIDEFPADLVDDALVLVSELVTNAVIHGAPDISVQVEVRGDGVSVGVHDGGGAISGGGIGRRPLRRPKSGATTGRGLMIVDTVAARWGVRAERHHTGKTVWFELQSA